MPEFPFLQSGWIETVGSVPASTNGTTITSSATVDTKGSWTELVAATSRDASWVIVDLGTSGVTAGSVYLVDIGIGSATEQVIIPDLPFAARSTGGNYNSYAFPILIPAGSRLTARCQCSLTGSQTMAVVIHLCAGTMLRGGTGASIVSSYGATASSKGTNVDPGGTAHADSAWVEITASTERQHNWLVVSVNPGDLSIAGASRWLVDIGIGSAAEQEIVSDLLLTADVVSDTSLQSVWSFPYLVPAASRLVARARTNNSTDVDRDLAIRIWGC